MEPKYIKKSTYSPKSLNGIRICSLITEVLRERVDLTLNTIIKNDFNDLGTFLKNKSNAIHNNNRINYEQKDKMYHTGGYALTTKDFDLTLCLALLRYLKLDAGQIENNERIRKIRNNFYGHISSMEFEDSDLKRLVEYKSITTLFDNIYIANKYQNYSIVAKIEFCIYFFCTNDAERIFFQNKINDYITCDIEADKFKEYKRIFEDIIQIDNEIIKKKIDDINETNRKEAEKMTDSFKYKIDDCLETLGYRFDRLKETFAEDKIIQKDISNLSGLVARTADREEEARIERKICSEKTFQKLDYIEERVETVNLLLNKKDDFIKKLLSKIDSQTENIEIQIEKSIEKILKILPDNQEQNNLLLNKLRDIILSFIKPKKTHAYQKSYNLDDVYYGERYEGSDYENEESENSENSDECEHAKIEKRVGLVETVSESTTSKILDSIKYLEDEVNQRLENLHKECLNDNTNIVLKLESIELSISKFLAKNVWDGELAQCFNDFGKLNSKINQSINELIESIGKLYKDNQKIKELIKYREFRKDSSVEDSRIREDKCGEGDYEYECESSNCKDQRNRELLKELLLIVKQIDPSNFEKIQKMFDDINVNVGKILTSIPVANNDDMSKSIVNFLKNHLDLLVVDMQEKIKKEFQQAQIQKENETLKLERKFKTIGNYVEINLECTVKNELRIECLDQEKNSISFSKIFLNDSQYLIKNEFEDIQMKEKMYTYNGVPFKCSLNLSDDLKMSCVYMEVLSPSNLCNVEELLDSEHCNVDLFEHHNLPANYELPSEEIFSRLERENAKFGEVSMSLSWNNENDLDLHVVDPNGEEIFYGHKKAKSGGELDVDMNANTVSKTPVENIVWPFGTKPPSGTYKVFVNFFCQKCSQNETAFKLSLFANNQRKEISDRIKKEDGKKLMYQFIIEPKK